MQWTPPPPLLSLPAAAAKEAAAMAKAETPAAAEAVAAAPGAAAFSTKLFYYQLAPAMLENHREFSKTNTAFHGLLPTGWFFPPRLPSETLN